MKEVSTAPAFGILLRKLKQLGIPERMLIDGFPITESELRQPDHRMDWGLFTRMCERFGELVGSDSELEDTGGGIVDPGLEVIGRATALLSSFASPRMTYWGMARFGIRHIFSNVDVTYTELGHSRVRLTLEIPAGYGVSECFFRIYVGVLSAVPRLIGAPASQVILTRSGRAAVYEVSCAPSLTLVARIRRMFRVLLNERMVFDEISESYRLSYESALLARRKEFEIRMTVRMAELARISAVAQLAGGISHEISTPLMVIQGSVEQLRAKLRRDGKIDREYLGQKLDRIFATTQRMAKLMESLRPIYGAQGREAESRPEPFSFSDVLEELRRSFGARAVSAGVELAESCPSEPVRIEADRVQVQLALLNLINNAFEAVETLSGERWIRIGVHPDGAHVRIRVANSGDRISESEAHRIFEPFYSTKPLHASGGLGLTLARRYIENQGGTLEWLRAEPNTTFEITLKLS